MFRVRDKSPKPKGETAMNRIPRNFNYMLIKAITDSNAGKSGDVFEVVKNDNGGYSGKNLTTEKEYHIFPSHIRNENLFEIVRVVA